MAGMSLLRSKLEAYVISANEALALKLVKSKEDIADKETTFHPEFTHQVFGDNESIFGYKDLEIQLYHSAASLITYLGIQYSDKIDSRKCEGVEADNIMAQIADKLQPGFHTNIDDFLSASNKDSSFVPHGAKIHEFSVPKENSHKDSYEIYQADIFVPGFKEYHERMQVFVLWFIDAASYIDVDDERWQFYTVYQKSTIDGKPSYTFAGYATIYHYYAYPNKTRPRISQLLVLPPFQKQGIGLELLQAIYNVYMRDNNVLNITVEDPSESFTRLRDYLDSKHCLKLPAFHSSKLSSGFTPEMSREAQKELKINKKQARRVYEILRLQVTNQQNEVEYRKYRLEIKKRLNIPFQKQQSDFAKLKKILQPEELKAALSYTSKEQRLEQLDRQYKELETEYQHVLEKLAVSDLNA